MAAKTKTKKSSETPLMKQYNTIKAKYPDAMLLFRVGDFYELFSSDAVKASRILGISLTARNNGGSKVELAGFPHHSVDTYLPKLVRAGQRVAICDQLEDPKMTKKIVKRGVTEVVTPGVSFNDKVLEHKKNNFLAAVHFGKKEVGVAFLDVSTGEFLIAEGTEEYVDKLLQGLTPSEVIYQKQKTTDFKEAFGDKHYSFKLEDWVFTNDFSNEILLKQFGTKSLKGFGIEQLSSAVIAAGAALHYLNETQHEKVGHITNISRIEEEKYVWLDRFTIRNLELLYSPNEDATTLIDILDNTISPMGARMLKRWMVLPLKDKEPIVERLDVVEHFFKKPELNENLAEHINQLGDIERLISKAAVARINPREIVQLHRALTAIIPIKELSTKAKNKSLNKIAAQLNPCEIIRKRIENEIHPDPPVLVSKGNVIAEGVNKELDDLRAVLYSGKEYLHGILKRESEKTGIPSLKIAFNNVFGYYLEVRNTHKDKVPEEWVRKQTLTQAERYITEELKEYETKILGAEEKIQALEGRLFNALVLDLADYVQTIQHNAQLLAKIDCLLCFANNAKRFKYCRPQINDTYDIDITEGRHPVIEHQLPIGEDYVSNNVKLDKEKQQIIMITGPNMSGKSALLRQTALIVLMAQIGSFVPAEEAKLGIIDKIFTRVGASDNISSGESTFMVEMNETASILNNLSDRSLVLLDEIGRGTSTYDGISIAWAIAEFIHQNGKSKPKTLFATHYHELNEMTKTFDRIKNYNVSIKEIGNRIIFMRKLVPGGSEHSFGIHVAKLAGMPNEVIKRANEVLLHLEDAHGADATAKAESIGKSDDMQLSFFQLDDPVLEQIRKEIKNLDINTLTPVEALFKLNEIKKITGG